MERLICESAALRLQLSLSCYGAAFASILNTPPSLSLSFRLPPSLSSVHPLPPISPSLCFYFPPTLSLPLLLSLSSTHYHLPLPPLTLWEYSAASRSSSGACTKKTSAYMPLYVRRGLCDRMFAYENTCQFCAFIEQNKSLNRRICTCMNLIHLPA